MVTSNYRILLELRKNGLPTNYQVLMDLTCLVNNLLSNKDIFSHFPEFPFLCALKHSVRKTCKKRILCLVKYTCLEFIWPQIANHLLS